MLTKLGIFPNFDGDPLYCTHFFRSSPFFDGFVSPFYAKTPNDEFDKPFRNKILITDFLSPFLKKFFMWDGLFSIEITIKSSIRLKGDSICLMSIQIKSLNSFLL